MPSDITGEATKPVTGVARSSSPLDFWFDAKIRGIILQTLVVVLLVWVGWSGYQNLMANMASRGLTFGYEYLDRSANFAIGESIIPFASTDSYRQALLVGFLNTLRVAVFGIVLATILGVVFGVARLSPNPLLSRMVMTYIEVVRNTPLLLQLFFWYAIILALPRPRDAPNPLPGVYVSNRGALVPWINWDDRLWLIIGAVIVALIAIFFMNRMARLRQERTGERKPVWPINLALLMGLPVLVSFVFQVPLVISWPVLTGLNFRGGATLSPEFAALLTGLTLYTAAFIAEIVRAGIQAVSKGQWEASRALGLPASRIMRLVILPQALRVIIPPLTSQFLNLTKNSSLAVAIGYPDLVHVSNTTMNQTGKAVEAISIFMGIYLALSLATSTFMNWYNTRVAMKER
jgi:general L-amino acid transport system permease protein